MNVYTIILISSLIDVYIYMHDFVKFVLKTTYCRVK